jgi:hypothetical protein
MSSSSGVGLTLRVSHCLALLLAATGRGALAQRPVATSDSLLDRLVGNWTVTGAVRGKPAHYAMTGARTLQQKYVELHMTDVAANPPAYEARVIIGQADKPDTYIAHWIDAFGAQYSVPPGTGTQRGDTLFLDFPYPTGMFHDTFAYDRGADRWHFRLESADGKGGWTVFADYVVDRARK